MSITSQITDAANTTAQMQAKTRTVGTASTNMTSDDFLQLMMKQLQYQDPMDPVDNKEFISQQAQFTQLSTTQEMSKNISSNNSIMQTLSIVGKHVTLTDPDDPKKTIEGTVSEAHFTSNGASILVNDKEYPISSVAIVKEDSSGTTNN